MAPLHHPWESLMQTIFQCFQCGWKDTTNMADRQTENKYHLRRITVVHSHFQSCLPNFEAAPKTSISQSILWKAIWRLENRLCGRLGPHRRSIFHILIFYLTLAVTQMWFGKIGKHCQIWDIILLGSVQWHRFYSDPTSLSIPVTLALKIPQFSTDYTMIDRPLHAAMSREDWKELSVNFICFALFIITHCIKLPLHIKLVSGCQKWDNKAASHLLWIVVH